MDDETKPRPVIDTSDKWVRRAIFVAAAGAGFVGLTWAGIVSLMLLNALFGIFNSEEGADIRAQHVQQHANEQVKYDEMIRLLEEIRASLESRAIK